MADIQKILDDIKELKLLEVAELVKLMEEEFGVSAAAPVMVAAAAEGGAAAEAVREQDQWLDAILNDKDPLVLPEQAFVVTQILEAIYTAAATGEQVKLA